MKAYDNKDVLTQIRLLKEKVEEMKTKVSAELADINALETQVSTALAAVDQAVLDAQQAVSTVDGYNGRLTAAENDIDNIQADYVDTDSAQNITGAKTFTAPVTASGGVVGDVTGDVTGNLTGDAAIDSGTVSTSFTVPTQPTGTFNTEAANGNKVKNELDAYAPMVRTTGNQNISGIKTFDRIQARVYGYTINTVNMSTNTYMRICTFNESCNFTIKFKGSQANNNLGWKKVYVGGTPIYARSQTLETVARYTSTQLIVTRNTDTGLFELIFSTGNLVSGNIEVSMVDGYMGSTFTMTWDTVANPSTDGIHDNVQAY